MGTVTRPEKWHPPERVDIPQQTGAHRRAASAGAWIVLAAVVSPVVVAAALIPWRTQLDASDNALFLVVVVVAVASTGRRFAAAVAAVVSGLSFDFFLTVPYESFRITRHSDFITEILLLVVGLAVGELASRGRRHREAALQGRHRMALLHSVTELAATGKDPQLVIATAARELTELLYLRDCRFTERHAEPAPARVTPDGRVTVGAETWPTADLGLPRNLELPVRSGGWLLGHFLLTPTPGKPVPSDRLLVAVAVADQVGVALAAEDAPNRTARDGVPDSGPGSDEPEP